MLRLSFAILLLTSSISAAQEIQFDLTEPFSHNPDLYQTYEGTPGFHTIDPRTVMTVGLGLGAAFMLENDKARHVGAGAAVSAITTYYTGDPLKGCLAALGAGLLKEAWDSRGHGQVEAADALATAAGCTFSLEW